MKVLILILLSCSAVFAQDQMAEAFAGAGCGSNETRFEVKRDKKPRPLEQPESGKALVYVFEEKDSGFCVGGCVTTRVGIDGAWVGANQGNSYFYFPIEPGDHHVCTAWQSRIKKISIRSSALSFTAEAGKVYYFRVRVINEDDPQKRRPGLTLHQLDNAEGPLLTAHSAFSTSRAKR